MAVSKSISARKKQSSKSGFKLNPGQARASNLLQGDQRHTLLAGGARSGKTFLLTQAVVVRALRAPESRHAILRFRANAVRASIALDTLPKVMQTCFPQVPLTERRQDGFFEFPNKAQIWIGGLDEAERVEKILGQEFSTLYFNECSQIPYSSITVARTRLAQRVNDIATGQPLQQRAYYDLNPTGANHWTNREFGLHVDPISNRPLSDPENYQRCFVNPKDNAENLTPEFLASLANLPEKQRKRFYEGEYVSEVEGALWTYDSIEKCRVEPMEVPQLTRVVVAVDPSGASGPEDTRSDEIGIVVVGKGVDGRAYVLADRSLRDGPDVWGRVAISAFHEFRANTIVGEINFGGGMVEFTIKARDPTVPFKRVRAGASRGKYVRAEPVSVLYATDKVRHVGRFSELEDQLVNFSDSGFVGDKSPDRADALVWGITDLMLGSERRIIAFG